MKVLIWQTAYLGDVVLATPLIRTLQKSFKDITVGFVGRPFILELLKGYNIDLIPFDKSFTSSFSIVEKIKDYTVVLSPHISARSALILFFSGIPTRIGFDRSELPWLYTHVVEHEWAGHEVDRNLKLLKPIGIKDKEFIRETKLFVDEECIKAIFKKFNLPEDYVVVSPFSNFPLKEWYMEGWVEVVKSLGKDVVLVGAKEYQEKAKNISERARVINLVGKTTLTELMAVVSKAKLVLSCDSSPVHIANAFGTPAISIYTSTSPHYGFYPTVGSYLKPDIPCSPCSPNPKSCKVGRYDCLKAVKPADVLLQASKFLTFSR
ncbi:MAG: glycosyltransferase family 9 protein [Aquificaceae bacterium]